MGNIPSIVEFANNGDTEEPGLSKKNEGWLVGEKPPAEWWNWLANRNDRRINQTILESAHARGAKPPSLTPYQMCMKNPVNQENFWHYPWTDSNSASVPSDATTATIGWDAVQERPILFVANHSDWATTYPGTADIWAFPCWDYETDMLTNRTNLSVSPGFSTSGSQRWYISLCAVGDYLYVLCRDASGAGIYVQKYSISNWTGTPINSVEINNGWSPTVNNTHLIQLSDDYLGVVLDFGSGTFRCVSINVSDCTLNGYQDITTHYNPHCIAADGTHLFIASEDAANAEVIRLDLPLFSSKVVIQQSAKSSYRVFDLLPLGEGAVLIYVSKTYGGATDPEPRIRVLGDVGGGFTVIGEQTELTPSGSAYAIPGAIGNDGTSAYLSWTDADNDRQAVHKIDMARLAAVNATSPTSFSWPIVAYENSFAYTQDTELTLQDIDQPQSMMLFDGRDMWVIHMTTASHKVFRICGAASRR